MKKSKKIFLRVLPILIVLMVFFTSSVFCNTVTVKPGAPTGGKAIDSITNLGANIWSTIAVIVQIAAIAAIVFAGVRYMFASADDKADIKKQTVVLIVGAVLVFAAVPLAKFITTVAKQTLGAE